MQFDRLCSLLLEAEAGLRGLRWRGRGDSARVAVVDGTVALRDRGIRLGGPVTVAVVWVRGGPLEGRFAELSDRVVLLSADNGLGPGDRLLVLTNLDGADSLEALREHAGSRGQHAVVLGAGEISDDLDRDAGLRLAMPSVLGLRDLGALIDPDVRGRSSLDVDGAQALARVFWPTHAYDRARAVLGEHRFVVLTGPPEMGKTAIAEMIALAQLTDGWEAHECNDPDQVWQRFDRGRRQLFIADDAFGSTEYRPDAADRWARGLGRLLTMLDSRHWLIWTSRPAPLKAGLRRVQRESGSERFPAPGKVLVDATDLDLADKTLILFRHAKSRGASGPARRMLRSAGLSIVEHPHFTPERIRRFVADRLDELPRLAADDQALVLRMVEFELACPTDAMRTSFRALSSEHRELLISLLDAPAGLIDERELAAVVRRHHAGGLSSPPSELIDRLSDHFLRVTPLGIGWVHPSWRDLVIDELQEQPAAQGAVPVRMRRRRNRACRLDARAGSPARARCRCWSPMPIGTRSAIASTSSCAGSKTGSWRRSCSRSAACSTRSLDRPQAERSRLPRGERPRHDPPRVGRATRARSGVPAGGVVRVERAGRPAGDRAGARADLGRAPPGWAPGRAAGPRRARARRRMARARAGSPALRPGGARRFGFFGRDRDLLEHLIVALTRISVDEALRPLSESVLARIEALVPDLAEGAHSAREIGRLVEGLGRKRWWVPEDLPAPPSTERATALSEPVQPRGCRPRAPRPVSAEAWERAAGQACPDGA